MELMVRDGEQIHRVRDAPAAETDRRATDGFSRSPLSRASRPFTALTLKVGKGSKHEVAALQPAARVRRRRGRRILRS